MKSPAPHSKESRPRVLFCGTPSFAVPTLRHLLTQPDVEMAAVITQPDRPRGRGQHVSFSPVKEIALAANLKIFQPEKIRTPDSEKFLRESEPDVIVIIAYGQIIPARLLNIPRLGWINLHASLLPKYRGAAPIQWAIAHGESVTGVTTMRIDAGMDTGDILLQRETPIGPIETTPQVAQRLAELGAPLMAETLRRLRDGTLPAKPQDHGQATLARLLKKEDGLIDWSQPAHVIYNRMRAFTPWPGAHAHFRGTTCQLTAEPLLSNTVTPACPEERRDGREAEAQARISPPDETASLPPGIPGTIHYSGKNLLVSCGQQSFLHVTRVKPQGRKEVSASDFANGAHIQPGEQFS